MNARLVLTSEETQRTLALDPTREESLGRGRECSIMIRDAHISRVHARIRFHDGRWWIADLESHNGTLLDNLPLRAESPLHNGQVIQIGQTSLRFVESDTDVELAACGQATLTGAASALQPDRMRRQDLEGLVRFMGEAANDAEESLLIARVLREIVRAVQADFAGFLTLDPEEPLPKIVVPESAAFDRELSRNLTARVEREQRFVWLQASRANEYETPSLAAFRDALGIPIMAEGRAFAAIHVYKHKTLFTEDDIHYCGALVGYLTPRLNALRESRRLAADNLRLRDHVLGSEELIGSSPAMVALREVIARVARAPSRVLIVGESGSGKELVTQSIHQLSPRASGPLVCVNAAAIPQTLLEAELFGYRKGAFTNADRDYPGLFQQADDGTLFLDEIAELSPDCQAKLLRVIETKTVRPLGTTRDLPVDVRVIAATNRDLSLEVRNHRFREDLYYRLKITQIDVPPLREHLEDLAELAEHFLAGLAREFHRPARLSRAALRKLESYSWPGNVRQLKSMLENALIFHEGPELPPEAFHFAESRQGLEAVPEFNLERIEWQTIEAALRHVGGNKTRAAELLGLHKDTLYKKLNKYGQNQNDEGR